ncbi:MULTISPECIES: hypothetical protein [unclassified Kitasatospora]|uniref:hypothetical protein n=1 Tax=unclassified Kitasatospora TaxID=2633591 RepID=UPI0007090751|nr:MULTISPECIES: hypothetical protein [unclassified Kitasatospora]KQV13957.1 hypothetical protein ASC99_32465 [Kitasatospora sp. Root107]KRB68921.1 hypothetical protein ASE03_28920 [Kitasatospora sp. Root187]
MPARNRRLPRHLSWPLTPSDLDAALGERMTRVERLYFSDRPHEDGSLLGIQWYGVNVHPTLRSRLSLTVGPLPATERAAARQILVRTCLPEVAAWIDEMVAASETWRQAGHYRHWRLAGDSGVTHRDDFDPYR